MHLVAASHTGGLWHAIRHPDGTWTHFGDVEGQTGERGQFVAVACAGILADLHVTGVTDPGRLWHSIRRGNGTWTPFGDIEGLAGDRDYFSTIGCARIGAELYVIGSATTFVDVSGALYHTIRHTNGAWDPLDPLDRAGVFGAAEGTNQSVACGDVPNPGEIHVLLATWAGIA